MSHPSDTTPPDGITSAKVLTVRCPSCGVMHPYRSDNPYRPFCSKGCKAIDLGAWASESYRVEAKPTTEDLSD